MHPMAWKMAVGALCSASASGAPSRWLLFGIPIEFVLFGSTLLGIAVFNRFSLYIALGGAALATIAALFHPEFSLLSHLAGEWATLANLLLLLLGFALVAEHVAESGLPHAVQRRLPDGWLGALVLLVAVFVISSVLDNIAAALIGATIATTVFAGRLHTGYLAAIVFAANAGGAGSVLGDTTTTMMWLDGVHPLQIAPAGVGAFAAMLAMGSIAAWQQQRHQPLTHGAPGEHFDALRLVVVAASLAAAALCNTVLNLYAPEWGERVPAIGLALWLALLLGARVRRPKWQVLPGAARGAAFLLALVFMASLMPVSSLPPASWHTALALGFVSAVFDNIPLTKLTLAQGGYDWAYVAYAVGVGGSLLWFGSSAGVAIAAQHPEAKSVGRWAKHGWHLAPAYVLGFIVLHSMLHWRADDRDWRDSRSTGGPPAVEQTHPMQPPVHDVRAE